MANITTNALSSGTEGADSVGNSEINLYQHYSLVYYSICGMIPHLAGIGLGRDGVCGGEPSLLAEDLVELDDLVGITLEKLEEGGLRTSSTLRTTELKALTDCLDILEIEHEFLNPLSRSFSYYRCKFSANYTEFHIEHSYQQ